MGLMRRTRMVHLSSYGGSFHEMVPEHVISSAGPLTFARLIRKECSTGADLEMVTGVECADTLILPPNDVVFGPRFRGTAGGPPPASQDVDGVGT